jgi:type IV secretion system protein VirB2
MKPILKRSLLVFGCLLALALVQTPGLWAAGTGGPTMPWNDPLQRLLDNLSGSTARTLGMLMFVMGGIAWGFSRNEEHVRKFGGALFGCAIAIGVVNLFNALAFEGALF